MDACLPAVVAAFDALVAALADTSVDAAVELEARFGYINPATQAFVSGVPLDVFDAMLRALEYYQEWDAVVDWTESRDCVYTTDGTTIRTSTSNGVVLHSAKSRLHKAALCASGRRVNQLALPIDVRVAVSRERLVLSRDVPEHVHPQWVRIKVRKSFVWRAWRWDVTRLWQATSFLEVDALRREHPSGHVFEVELELAKPGEYLHRNTTNYAARSLTLKLFDMVAPIADDATLAYYPPEHFTP